MPGCFVVFCKSGYSSSKEQVSLFRAPTDIELFERWKSAIPAREVELTQKSRVCAKHFREEDIIRFTTAGEGDTQFKVPLRAPRLAPNAVPSIFPNVPQYCIPVVQKPRKPPTERGVIQPRKPPTKRGKIVEAPTITSLSEMKIEPNTDRPSDEEMFAAGPHITDEKEVESFVTTGSSTVNVDAEEYAAGSLPLATKEADLCVAGPSSAMYVDDDSNTREHASLESDIRPSGSDSNRGGFNTWDAFDAVELPTSTSWIRFIIDETKLIAQMRLSNHVEPRPTAVQEVRTTKNSNEVRTLVHGKEFSCREISSLEELIAFLTGFFDLAICCGVKWKCEDIKTLKHGRRNILNRWQSVDCPVKYDHSDCEHCTKLEQAILMKQIRMKTQPEPRSSEKKRKFIRSVATIRKAKRRLQFSNIKLKEEKKALEQKIAELSDEVIDTHIARLNVPPAQAMVIKEILRIAKYTSKNSKRYSSEWLLTCLLMHIRSPSMYAFIAANGILPLPSSRTIKRHLQGVKISCGFDEAFLEALKLKMASKTELQKYAILVFDEVSVRKSLKLDPKTMRYQGVVDFGDDAVASTEYDQLADHGLVFGFSSLADNYFQPIGCFAAKGATPGVILAKLIVQAIILLETAGVKIIAMVCDGAKPNRRMWREFGITGQLGSTTCCFENPYDEDRKIFVLSDVPHLFKCIRNRLLKYDLMTKFGIVRWRHYQVLYLEDKKLPANVRLCPRITNAHVFPNSFARMRVSLMTQIFSKSAAIGLDKYRERLTEELEDSEPTSKFSLYMNNLFDCLNRRYAGEGIRPGSPDIDTIKEGLSFLDDWEKKLIDGVIKDNQFLTKETAEGLRVTLHSVIGIIKYLHEQCGFSFVLTAKLTQDVLEFTFSIDKQTSVHRCGPCWTRSSMLTQSMICV